MEVRILKFHKLGLPTKFATLTAILVAGFWPSTSRAQMNFKEDVFPIIELRCLECHQPGGAGYEKSELDLRTYEGLMKGTKFGAVIIPRSAIGSTLIAVIERRTSREIWMPHERKNSQSVSCEQSTIGCCRVRAIINGTHSNICRQSALRYKIAISNSQRILNFHSYHEDGTHPKYTINRVSKNIEDSRQTELDPIIYKIVSHLINEPDNLTSIKLFWPVVSTYPFVAIC